MNAATNCGQRFGESHGWNAHRAGSFLPPKTGQSALGPTREGSRGGRADAFRKVAEWCQTSVPDTIDFDASIVEEVAKGCHRSPATRGVRG